MADGQNFLGLYLALKQQRLREQENQASQEAQREANVQRVFREALDIAGTGDKKGAIAYLRIGSRDNYPTEMEDLIGSVATNAKQREQQAEQAAALKAARPNEGAQTDLARGLGAQLLAPGNPLQNAISGLRTLESVPHPLGTQLAQRGGAIAGERMRAAAESDRRRAFSSAESIRTREATRTEAGESLASQRRGVDRRNETDSAWESFTESGFPWEEWKAEAKRSDWIAAMRHPGFTAMRGRRLQRPMPQIPLMLPGTSAPELAAPEVTTKKNGKKKITTSTGFVIEEE